MSDTNYGGKIPKAKQRELIDSIDKSPTGVFYAIFRRFVHIISSDKIMRVK